MFWRKKKETQVEQNQLEPDGPIIAALLMQGDRYDTAALQQKLSQSRVFGESFRDISTTKGILTAYVGDEMIAVAPMPAPYPWSDLEGPCHTSWMWPPGTSAMSVQPHRSHVLVTVIQGQANRVQRRMKAAQITALAASQPDVMGIYWADATLVHYPPLFIEMAMESTAAAPLYLLVDYRVFANENGTHGLFTTGLRALGLMEIEIPQIDFPPGELREWGVNISYYLLDRGSPIPDGDTIGVSETHKMRVRHTASSFGAEGKVMRIT
jgi:hypothetical protein